MPHYKDFSGRFIELPGSSGEFWGAFDSEADLTQASTKVEWSTFEPASPPAALGQQALSLNFWQSNDLATPQAFAIMVDPEFTNPDTTGFKIWDVSWNSSGVGDLSERTGTFPFRYFIGDPPNGQKQSLAEIDHVYFQVDTIPPLAVPALGLPEIFVLASCLIGSALFATLRRTRRKIEAMPPAG